MVIAGATGNEFVADQTKAAGNLLGQAFGLGRSTMGADVEDVGQALAGRAAFSRLRPRTPSTHLDT